MKILSIDPGYERLGVAIIEIGGDGGVTKSGAQTSGGAKNTTPAVGNKKEVLLFSDCITTSPKLPHHKRLLLIGESVAELIETWQPDELAIEALFFNDNQKTAILVAQAFGVVVYGAARKNIPVFSYTPLQVKVAVTSYGRSNKEQVQSMVERLIDITTAKSRRTGGVKKAKILDDEYDAIAIGLTHAASRRTPRS